MQLLFFSTTSAGENETPFLEKYTLTTELKDSAGFVWPGTVRTISIEGDSSTCKLMCNIYLDNQKKGSLTNKTYEIQSEIAFTGLGPGLYTISANCRAAAKAYCIIEPGSLDFEVEDEYSQRMFDNINLGTLHVRVEEKEVAAARGSSVLPAVIMITILQAIGLFVISEAVKRKMAHS